MPKSVQHEIEFIAISHPYKNDLGVKTFASVNLTINYDERNFSIESSCHDGAFRFQKNSHKNAMWDALVACIKDAIKIGKEKLNLK